MHRDGKRNTWYNKERERKQATQIGEWTQAEDVLTMSKKKWVKVDTEQIEGQKDDWMATEKL